MKYRIILYLKNMYIMVLLEKMRKLLINNGTPRRLRTLSLLIRSNEKAANSTIFLCVLFLIIKL